MIDKRVPDNDDELGALDPVVEAIRTDVPDDTQWGAAQGRLMAALELAARHPATPSTLVEQRRNIVLRWYTAAAAMAAVVAVVLWIQISHLPLGEGPGVRIGNSDPWPVVSGQDKTASEESLVSNPQSLILDPLETSVGRVEQTYAVFVRPKNTDRERPLGTRDVLRAGDRLRVAPQGGLQLRLDDGSRLWLTANTEAECVGTRSNDRPAWRLTRGEIQADIARGTETFRIATPGGGLRVLGTEFHVRVYPDNSPRPIAGEGPGVRASGIETVSNENSTNKETIAMKSAANILQRAIVVLTVLSGSVAVEADDQEKVVTEGNRATYVVSGPASLVSTDVPQVEYLRKWVTERINQPAEASRSEVLAQITLSPAMLTRVLAVDVETGKTRPIADFIGAGVNVNQIGHSMAFARIGSILHSSRPVSGAGNPIANSTVDLIDLKQGDKVTLEPLAKWSTLYAQMSPDRRKIAFLGCKSGEYDEYGLYVADMETFKPVLVLKGGMKTIPAWSPDSRWIAISKAPGYTNAHEIVLIDTIDGTVKSTNMKGTGAAFSPDGKQLVYSGGFKQGGSWAQGVPMSGNLFIATVPDGQPEQLSQLPEGGALQPVFSPDGSYVAYVARPSTDKDEVGIYIVDAKTKKDSFTCTITNESARLCGPLQWVDDRSKLVTCYQRPTAGETESSELCVIQVEKQKNVWAMSNPTFKLPDAANDEGVKIFSKRLMDIFELNSAAIKANDLQEFEDAKEKYTQACKLIEAIDKDLVQGAGAGVEAVKLRPIDLQPYLEAMSKKAAEALSPEHSVETVRKNLRCFVTSPLGGYYGLYGQFPPAEKQSDDNAAPSFAEWVANPAPETMRWQVNHVRGDDRQRVQRMFLVPGDDPAKKATSYEVVRSGKDELVLRTPPLADGKRLEATYKVEGSETYKDDEGKERKYVHIKATVTEVK